MLYVLYRVAFFLTNTLSIRAGYALATAAARIYFMFSGKDKKALRENLRMVLGGRTSPAVIDAHVMGVFKNFAKYLADFFRFSKMSEDYVLEHIELEGVHHVDECLSEGKGAIMVSAHLGNWELGGAVVAALGYPISAIVLEHEDKRINDLFVRQRAINDMKIINIGMQLKQCFKVLRSNELLAIMGDKDYTGNTECVEFFGKKAFLPKGAAVLSLKTGAPIVVCALVRKEDDTFKFQFERPIKHERTGDHDNDVKGLMRMYLAVFERYIRERPDQWYVFGKIWKQEPITR